MGARKFWVRLHGLASWVRLHGLAYCLAECVYSLASRSPLKEDSTWQEDWRDLSSRECSDALCSGCQWDWPVERPTYLRSHLWKVSRGHLRRSWDGSFVHYSSTQYYFIPVMWQCLMAKCECLSNSDTPPSHTRELPDTGLAGSKLHIIAVFSLPCEVRDGVLCFACYPN